MSTFAKRNPFSLFFGDPFFEGAYTGSRLAAWISSNFATAKYSETTNSLGVATGSF